MEISAYVRVSLDQTGEGISVENQETAIRKWAKEHGHTIGTVYIDNDISATSGKIRPGFEQMLKDSPSAIVVWTQDRLLRVSKDLERVLETGMVIHQVIAGSLDLASEQGKAVARTITAWTTFEVKQKAARQKLRNAADAKAGKPYWRPGIEPFGWNVDGTLHPEQSKALKEVVRLIVEEGKTVAHAVKYLQGLGISPVRGSKAKGFKISPWRHTTLSRMLTDMRLIAVRTYVVERIKNADGTTTEIKEESSGTWTPLLTLEEFEDLQIALKHRQRTYTVRNRENLLTSIAQCGKCGGSMGQTWGGNGTVAVYQCSRSKDLTKNADLSDAVIMTEVIHMLSAPDADDILTPNAEVGLGQLRKNYRAELADWAEWQAEAAQEGMRPGEYKLPRAMHEERLSAIETEILRLGEGSIFSGIFRGDPLHGIKTDQIWEGLGIDEKRSLVKALFSSITFQPVGAVKRFDPLTIEFQLSEIGAKLWQSSTDNQTVIDDAVMKAQAEWINRPKDAIPYRPITETQARLNAE